MSRYGLIVVAALFGATQAYMEPVERILDAPVPPLALDEFGVAIDGDSTRVLVGAPGHYVDLDGAGNYAQIGQAHLFDLATGSLLLTFDDPNQADGNRFGSSVALSGNYALVASTGYVVDEVRTGQVHLFDASTGSLLHTFSDPTPPSPGSAISSFGSSVAVAGKAAFVSEQRRLELYTNPGDNVIHHFDLETREHIRTYAHPSPSHCFPETCDSARTEGYGQALDAYGNRLVVGAAGEEVDGVFKGRVYIFDTQGGELLVTLDSPNVSTSSTGTSFGRSVAIYGDRVAVGSSVFDDSYGDRVGGAYLFDTNTGVLVRSLFDPAGGGPDVFGNWVPADLKWDGHGGTIDLDAHWVLIGNSGHVKNQYFDDGASVQSITSAGRAYRFNATTGILLETYDDPTPSIRETLYEYMPYGGDHFGSAVVLVEGYTIIGAPFDTTAYPREGTWDIPVGQVHLIPNDVDDDGVLDSVDALPLDANETVDTDSDGIGNNADTDDDGDGVADTTDTYPLDATESVDTDGDGVGNNADTDDDNDGVADSLDAFPLDASESVDTDGDGIGNNADTDDDGDGDPDSTDNFPLYPKSDCFIATAAFGSYENRYVVVLRQFRDEHLLTNQLGTQFVDWYYTYSPPIAETIASNESLRKITRLSIYPLVGFAHTVQGLGWLGTLGILFIPALGLVMFRKKAWR